MRSAPRNPRERSASRGRALGLLPAALLAVACGAPERNVVLVTLDTTRADALTPYGQPLPTSPNVARMAAEGVLFEQVSASSPSTLPSHASILTGRHPFEHGVRANAGYRLPASATTLAELLRERGYRTGAEIAASVLDAGKGLEQGFDRYRDLRAARIERITARAGADAPEIALDERPAADVTRAALRFVEASGKRPFFLWLHYFDPHLFYVHRPEFAERVGGEGYLAEVLYTDAELGTFLDGLEASGLRERTLVVLVGDHGEGLGEHGESTHSFFVYESTIRVPLLLWGPRSLPEGRRVASPVRTIDVMPTILDWLGMPPPADVAGTSLLPLVSGARSDLELAAYGESVEFANLYDASPLRFLRRGRWKYVHDDVPELYDLAEDPGERRDLASRHPERVAALRAELAALLAGAAGAEDAVAPVTPEERARLEALGYAVPTDAGADRASRESLDWRGPAPASLIADTERAVEASGLLRLGRAEAAERMLAELVRRHPRSATLLRDHAEALVALGRRDEAMRALSRALEASTCAARERITLAGLHREAGRHRAQHEVLREGVERCGEVPELLNNYAWELATGPDPSLRDGARAEALARRALAASAREVPEILDTLAAAQAAQGEPAAAVDTLRRAMAAAREQGRPAAVIRMLARSLERVRAGRSLARDPDGPG